MIERCRNCFREQHAVLWPALSRTINVIAILNVSLFFLNGAVRTGGYWFPLVSLVLLALVMLLVLLPLGLHTRLGFYLVLLAITVIAAWLLGASVVYWLQVPSE